MYLLHTMPTIAPEHHYVLMREVDMSAALHASDRPAKKQLSPKMQCKRRPTNVFDKEKSYHGILMYLLHTMPTIAPEHHYVLMRELDTSAALHASDRPAKKQLSPNNAMQEPTNVFDKEQSYHDTTCHK